MALPLPRVVADVGPGGGLVTAMGGINALHNAMIERKMNQIKAQYLPLTSQADAASKLAYANLMGPQFLAKLLQNPGAIANMGDPAANAALQKAVQAGMGQGTGLNYLNNIQQPTGVGQPSTNNFAGFLKNAFKNLIGQGSTQTNNPFAQAQNMMPKMAQQPSQAASPPISPSTAQMNRPKGGVTLEGEQWYNNKGEPVYAEELQQNGQPAMDLTLTGGHRGSGSPTWAENTGRLQGTQEEGKVLGKHRADAINDIGNQQMQFSTTGANLDRIIDDINDPQFMALRNAFPFYQDMQLKALSKIGSPEQQEMIGNFIADVKSFAGATVNSFKGQSMKREFDYADQLKPNENDTVASARGKLTALKSLKEIGQKKNDIILDLMQDKHMNLGDAVKQANKMVDIKAIGQHVKELTQPKVTLKNKKTGVSITVTLKKARELGVPNV